MSQNISGAVIAYLKKEVERNSEDLAMGGAKSFDAYREKCGFIRGLNYAISEITRLEQVAENE